MVMIANRLHDQHVQPHKTDPEGTHEDTDDDDEADVHDEPEDDDNVENEDKDNGNDAKENVHSSNKPNHDTTTEKVEAQTRIGE